MSARAKENFMERLTRDKDGNIYLKDGSFISYMMSIRKLAEYEDLEEQGLLLRLPCKVIMKHGECRYK